MGITTAKFDPTKNIPQLNSKADEWISWHKTLKASFGKKVANALWMKAWAKRGSSSNNTTELRGYMESQGVKIDSSAFNKLVDMGAGIGDFVGNVFQAGQIVTIVLGVAIVGGTIMVLFNLTRKNGSLGDVAKTVVALKGK